tara:strand:+ start:220 stop:501 length:282 start_codon:yes stop_codon:yes gene_type:complete
MRQMDNAKHVPEKRRRLLPGIVQSMITDEENQKFTTIKEGEDFQTDVARMNLRKSTLGQELLNGPGDGEEMLSIIFEHWLSPAALQEAIKNLD